MAPSLEKSFWATPADPYTEILLMTMATASTTTPDLTARVHAITLYPGLYVVESRTAADTAYLTDVRDPLDPGCTCPHGKEQAVQRRHPYCWHVRAAVKANPALYAQHLEAATAARTRAAPTYAA